MHVDVHAGGKGREHEQGNEESVHAPILTRVRALAAT
jgi:hypothetical protein